MRQKAAIRLESVLASLCGEVPYHPALARGAQYAMIEEMHPAEKVDAGGKRLDEYLARMERQRKRIAEKFRHARNEAFEPCPILAQYHEIVGVADIVPGFEPMLGELVEFVHVDVHEELRGEVAERQALPRAGRIKAHHDF